MDSRQTSGHGVRTVRARRLAIALIVACALGAMSIGSVSAGRGETVGPAFMTPTLNPSFDWECWRAADRIVCEGTAIETWTAIEIAPCSDGGALYR